MRESKSGQRPRNFFMRTYLINPKFQYNFMAHITGIVLFSMAVIYLSNYFFINSFIEKGQNLNLPKGHPFFILLQEQREYLGKVFFISCLVIAIGVGIWGLLYSHRIAGPLYRLRKEFLNAANEKRKLKDMRFRKGDFFQELPSTVNLYFTRQEKYLEPKDKAS